MSTLKYERLITKLLLGENISISNFNIANENEISYLTFEYSPPYGDVEKTCIVQINLNTNSLKEIKEFIKEEFYPEFSKMLNKDDDDGDVEDYMEGLYSSPDEDDDEDYESESSVAAGLGFCIDDDGEWVPDDNLDDVFYNYEYPRIYEYEHEVDKDTIVIEKQYDNFLITYQIKE